MYHTLSFSQKQMYSLFTIEEAEGNRFNILLYWILFIFSDKYVLIIWKFDYVYFSIHWIFILFYNVKHSIGYRHIDSATCEFHKGLK